MPFRGFIRNTSKVTAITTLVLGAVSGSLSALFLFVCGLLGAQAFDALLALVIHSPLIALGYAMIFKSAHRSGLRVGFQLAIFHYTLAGLYMSFTEHGLFGLRSGATHAILIALSIFIYGVSLGLLFDRAAMKHQRALPIIS